MRREKDPMIELKVGLDAIRNLLHRLQRKVGEFCDNSSYLTKLLAELSEELRNSEKRVIRKTSASLNAEVGPKIEIEIKYFRILLDLRNKLWAVLGRKYSQGAD